MKTRLISAAVLLPVMFLSIWVLPKIITAILVGGFAAISAYELLYRTGFVRHVRLVAYSAAAAFLVSIWSYFGNPQAWGMLGLVAYICALFGEMMCNHVKVRFEKICYCVVAGRSSNSEYRHNSRRYLLLRYSLHRGDVEGAD